ncbi:MAG: GntR family transcriptional regulator [Bacteroidota bacterium]
MKDPESNEKFLNFLKIEEHSKTPKYKQIIDTIVSDIENGIFKIGERIPSINETSEEFYLSRDTVERAYKVLKKKGLIVPVKGKGYFVASTGGPKELRILMLLNKLGEQKKTIYNAFEQKFNLDEVTIDLIIHNCNPYTLESAIIDNLSNYDYYVVMPHVDIITQSLKDTINKIPEDKLILINQEIDGIEGRYASVYEDYENDIESALIEGYDSIKNYKRLKLVFPLSNHYRPAIKNGFTRFCEAHHLSYEITDSFKQDLLNDGDLYIVIEEHDLCDLIKTAKSQNLNIGEDVGIICYNDSPVKEILIGGISVITTDFKLMGETAANFILEKKRERIKNPFSLIKRGSI